MGRRLFAFLETENMPAFRNDTQTMQLQEQIDNGLSIGTGRLRLIKETQLPMTVRRILANFDHWHSPKLAAEQQILLSENATFAGNMEMPASFQRTIIKETYSDFKLLDLVNVLTDQTMQSTTAIPYEIRLPGTLFNDGIVAESSPIPKAGIRQELEFAYINAMKMSAIVSNEAQFFSASISADWDAMSRCIASNAGLIRERVCRRIANEMQRASDAYQASAVTGEDIAGQLDGGTSLLKLANWPLVRPHQQRNLQGTAIGDPECPITLTINSAEVPPFDGSGNQSAGIYYAVANFNLGLIRLVDQIGEPVTPTASTSCTIDYHCATNVTKFDVKLPANTELSAHIDGALDAIGAARATLDQKRFVKVDFALMSPVLNNVLTNARSFNASWQRTGSTLSPLQGDLDRIKSIECWATNVVCDLGDERAILGQSGTLSYAIAKPFFTGTPFERQDTNGPTGEKVAYGEEYSAIVVPSAIRHRLTSVIIYDSDARAAAV